MCVNQLHDTSSRQLNHEDEIIVSRQLNAIGKVQIFQQNFGRIVQWIVTQQPTQ